MPRAYFMLSIACLGISFFLAKQLLILGGGTLVLLGWGVVAVLLVVGLLLFYCHVVM